MTTIFGNNYNNIAAAGETPIYQLAGGAGSSVSKYSSGWLAGSAKSGGDPNISNDGEYIITHNLGTTDIDLIAYVNLVSASDSGDVYSVIAPTVFGNYQVDRHAGVMIIGLTSNTVTVKFGLDGFAFPTINGWASQQGYTFENAYIKFVVTG